MTERLPTVGSDTDTWGTVLNGFLGVSHNADGTQLDGSVSETSLTLTDVTTANASTSKHGLLLKLDGNTAHFLRADGTWQTPAGGSADQLGLAPTAVKTSSYTAAVGDLVPVDTTSAGVTITLPTAPTNGSVIAVKHVIRGSTNTVTINAGGSDVFNKASGSTSLTLTPANAGVLLQYKATGAIWYVVTDSFPYSSVVDSVTATDTSIVVAGTSAAPTIATGTLDVIATQHPPAANWSNNSHKITSVSNGSASGDAATWDQTSAGIVTAKGDLIVGTGSHTSTNLAVGSNTFVLTADSTQSSGIKWAAAGSGSPTADPLATGLGYKNWNWNLMASAATASGLTSQRVYMNAIWLPTGTTCSTIVYAVQTASSGTAPTGFFVGLATTGGTMVAQSNNVGVSVFAQGPLGLALNATYTTNTSDAPLGVYYVVTLQNGNWGTTNATFLQGAGGPIASGKPYGSNPAGLAIGGTGGQTTLPGNGTAVAGGVSSSASMLSSWVAVA